MVIVQQAYSGIVQSASPAVWKLQQDQHAGPTYLCTPWEDFMRVISMYR